MFTCYATIYTTLHQMANSKDLAPKSTRKVNVLPRVCIVSVVIPKCAISHLFREGQWDERKWENSIMQHYHIQYSPKHKLAYIVLTVKVEMHYAAAV